MKQKVVKIIEVVSEFWPYDDYSSHRPLLYVSLWNTGSKPVCEFGCGEGSTNVLRKYCKRNNRFFSSYETNKEYADKYNSTKVNDYKLIHLSDGEFRQGVLLIDSAPGEERKDLIDLHRTNADVIVIHDSEESSSYVYGLRNILNTFNYRLDYQPEGKPHTTAVSNFIDVTQWV